MTFFEAQNQSSLIQLESKRVNLRGYVCGQPQKRGDNWIFELQAEAVQISIQDWQAIPPEKVSVYLFETESVSELESSNSKRGLFHSNTDVSNSEMDLSHIAYGNEVTVHGKLVLPKPKCNPGEFDYRQYLKYRQIHTLFYVYHQEDVVSLGEPESLSQTALVAELLGLKERFSQRVFSQIPQRQAVLLLAMLFGEQGAVEEADLELFRETGLAHALSVSGFHVGLVLLLVLTLCRTLRAKEGVTLAVAITVLGVYSVLSGFSVTVVRSAIMGTVGLLAAYLDRERNLYHALALSGLAILLWNPNFLFDAGFQLSFAAVLAITGLGPFLSDLLPECFLGREAIVSVPLAAQLGTLPIIAWHFSMISTLAVFANILLVPLISAVVIIGLLSFVLFKVTLISELLLQGAGFLLQLVLWFGKQIGSLPGTVFYVARPSLFRFILYYSLIFVAVGIGSREVNVPINGPTKITDPWDPFKIETGHRLRVFVLFLAMLTVTIPGSLGGDLTLTFLDVGQGDAIFIRSPSGATALIDGGGVPDFFGNSGYDPGRDTVLPFLRRQGLNRVDLLINTHPDADHLAGLQAVLEEVPVGQVITPPVKGLENEYSLFLSTARSKKVPHRALAQGDQINLDGDVIIQVLAPSADKKYQNVNDSSLMLMLCHGDNSFLFTGDVEEEGIRSLLEENSRKNTGKQAGKNTEKQTDTGRSTDKNSLACEVIKIPHHGSRGSFVPDLYEETQSQVAVISVGRNNNFGHPSRDVVEHLHSLGTLVFRTDKHGAVIITSDGKKCFQETVRQDW